MRKVIILLLANFTLTNFTLTVLAMEQDITPKAQSRLLALPDELILHIFDQKFNSILNTSNNIEEAINKSLKFIKTVRLISCKYNNFLLDLVKSLNKALLESNKFKELLNKKFKSIIAESQSLNKAIKKSLEFIKSIKLTSNIFTDFRAYLYKLFKESINNSNLFSELKSQDTDQKNKKLLEISRRKDLPLDLKFYKIYFLLESGADVDTREHEYSITPLIFAVFNNDINLVKLLINSGADVNARDKFNRTALMWITALNPLGLDRFPIAELLINNGAYINTEDIYGVTPLMHAARKDLVDLAQLLIANNADINATDYEGNTVLDIAKTHNSLNVIELIQEKCEKKPSICVIN